MIAKSCRLENRLRSLDPFEIEPTALSGIELRWLAERWPLAPAADGPLGFLRTEPRRLADGERQRAESGLRVKGLLREQDEPIPIRQPEGTVARGGLLRRSLTILERPEARLRIGLRRPGLPPRQVQLYIAGGQAALGRREGDCFYVGPPIDTVALATTIFRNLESEPLPGAGPAIGMWPFLMDLVSELWPTGGPQPLRALPRAEAVEALRAAHGGDAGLAEALLHGLVTAGVVREEHGQLAVSPTYRPWLEAVLSGHLVEIEHTPVRKAWDDRPADTDRLLFAGPPGRRALCGYLGRSLLEEGVDAGPVAGSAGLEDQDAAEQFLFLTQLSERALAVRLRELLHI